MNIERYEIYEDSRGEWRWRLRAANGRVIADGGEGYSRRDSCRRAVSVMIRTAQTPLVVYA